LDISEVAYAYYAPPPGWIGREVSVQWDGVHVRLLDPTTGALLREHRRQAPGHHAIHPADRPARTPPTTLTLLARALRAGAHIGTLCETIHRRDGEAGVRRILGVLTLVKKHGAVAVEDACATALELAVADYRFVRRYLERQPAAPLTLRQVDPLIRDLTGRRPCPSSGADAGRAAVRRGSCRDLLLGFARDDVAIISSRGCSRPKPRSWPPSTSSPRSSRTSSCAARTGSSSAASSRPASATVARPSTPLTSTSTRR